MSLISVLSLFVSPALLLLSQQIGAILHSQQQSGKRICYVLLHILKKLVLCEKMKTQHCPSSPVQCDVGEDVCSPQIMELLRKTEHEDYKIRFLMIL